MRKPLTEQNNQRRRKKYKKKKMSFRFTSIKESETVCCRRVQQVTEDRERSTYGGNICWWGEWEVIKQGCVLTELTEALRGLGNLPAAPLQLTLKSLAQVQDPNDSAQQVTGHLPRKSRQSATKTTWPRPSSASSTSASQQTRLTVAMPTHMVTMELAVLVNIQGEKKPGEKTGRTSVSFSGLLDTKLAKGFIFTCRTSQRQFNQPVEGNIKLGAVIWTWWEHRQQDEFKTS